MIREVIWIWSAEADVQEIFVRSDDARPGSGERFLLVVDRLLDLLKQFPEMTAIWRKPVRRALIRRSHYGLFYAAEPTKLVVIAILDLRRSPASIRQEIERRLP
jgi:plasmid stabilization system protein ParE